MTKRSRMLAGFAVAMAVVAIARLGSERIDATRTISASDRALVPRGGYAARGRVAPARATQARTTPAEAADAPPPIDIDAIIRQVHLAFRPDVGATYLAGTEAFEIRVDEALGMQLSTRIDGEDGDAKTASLALAPARLSRGGEPLGGDRAPATLAGPSELERSHDDVLERLRHDESGLSQTWSFPRAPRGDGDVEVRIGTRGARHVVTNASGAHFAARDAELGFRYGHATFVEDDGRRTSLPVTVAGSDLVVRIPDALLDEARFPAVLDPVITAELSVDGPLPGPAFGTGGLAAAAWAPAMGTYLVAWVGNDDVYCTRVTAAGTPVDLGGILIADRVGGTYSIVRELEIATNGTDFLVAWVDELDFSSPVGSDVHAKRVSGAGVVLDASPILVSTAAGMQDVMRLASDGVDYVAVWEDERTTTQTDIYAARITSLGVVRDPTGLLVRSVSDSPDVTCLGTNCLVVYSASSDGTSAQRGVFGRRLNTATAALSSSFTIANVAGYAESQPAVAANGTEFMVAWSDARADATNGRDLYGARVTATSTVLDATGFPIAITAADEETRVDLFARGGNYYATWYSNVAGTSQDVLFGANVPATGGAVSGTVQLRLATNTNSETRGASDGSSAILFPNRNTAMTRILTGTSTLSASYALWVRANPQTAPVIASNADRHLVAWYDERSPAGVYGVRVTHAGSVEDSSGLLLSGTGATVGSAPSVATDGTDFLVAYVTSGVRARRISGASGAVLDATAINPSMLGNPEVAYAGGHYLVVAANAGTVSGRRVTPSATMPEGAAFTIGTGTEPSVASNGTDFLAAFSRNLDIYAARITAAGTVLDAAGIPVSTASGSQVTPAVASNGTDYAVVWSDTRSGAADIYGARVTSLGMVSDVTGIPVALATNDQTLPAIAWNGTDYLVVWADLRAASSDIYGTRFYANGSVENAATGTLFTGHATLHERTPALASGRPLAFLLGYVVTDTNLPYAGSDRVRLRSIAYGSGPGSVCNTGTDCDSGYCVDGVCCTTPCAGGTADCQACSIAAGAPADGTCATVSVFAAYACRPAAGPCDAAELCNGSSNACPGDTVRPAGAECRASVDVCDVAEVCGGSSIACPSDGYAAMGTSCRASGGSCDVPEACSGTEPTCPPDFVLGSGTECRASAGACDVAEVCDGSSGVCPGDVVSAMGTVCRAADGDCDVAESCNGASPSCPIDGFKGNNSQCDISHGDCDFADYCTGAGPDCPEDIVPNGTLCDDSRGCTFGDACANGACVGVLQTSGTECRPALGTCDVAEVCDGVADSCPVDAVMPQNFTCRASSGPCDPAESCNGMNAACPGDVRAPLGTVCRSAAGACDVLETCDGTSSTCPTDAYMPTGSPCRIASSACDVTEFCAGMAECPGDAFQTDGTPCDDGLTCSQTSACQLGACQSAITLDCSDGDPCTTDVCTEPTGCGHVPVPACMDAGTDAGTPLDAGQDASAPTDSGASVDAGAPPGTAAGCSCRVAGGTPTPNTLAMLVVGLCVMASRRSSRTRRCA